MNLKTLAAYVLKNAHKKCFKHPNLPEEQTVYLMSALKGHPQTRTCDTRGCLNMEHYADCQEICVGDIEDVLVESEENPNMSWMELSEGFPHIKPMLVAGILYKHKRMSHFTQWDIRYFQKLKEFKEAQDG